MNSSLVAVTSAKSDSAPRLNSDSSPALKRPALSSSSPPSSSSSRPAKGPRLLRRTETYITLDARTTSPPMTVMAICSNSRTNKSDQSPYVPYHRSLRYQKEQRDKRRRSYNTPTTYSSSVPATAHSPGTPSVQLTKTSPALLTKAPPTPEIQAGSPATKQLIAYTPSLTKPIPDSLKKTSTSPKSSRISMPRPRTSSPLSPVQKQPTPRQSMPSSKREPNLYKLAIRTRMKSSPEGAKILHMGARLAFSIYAATKELEALAALAQAQDDDEEQESEPEAEPTWAIMSNSDWNVIPMAF